jgi:hypothetical protein
MLLNDCAFAIHTVDTPWRLDLRRAASRSPSLAHQRGRLCHADAPADARCLLMHAADARRQRCHAACRYTPPACARRASRRCRDASLSLARWPPTLHFPDATTIVSQRLSLGDVLTKWSFSVRKPTWLLTRGFLAFVSVFSAVGFLARVLACDFPASDALFLGRESLLGSFTGGLTLRRRVFTPSAMLVGDGKCVSLDAEEATNPVSLFDGPFLVVSPGVILGGRLAAPRLPGGPALFSDGALLES